MTKPTITTLGIATVYFVTFGLVLIYAFVTVQSQRAETMNLRTTLAEQNTKQAAARTVESTISSTETVRTELSSFFLPEKDTISFIAEIEDLAGAVGVSIETTALDIVRPADAVPELKTGFVVKGSRAAVMNFLRAIETLPYHSRVPVMNMADQGDATWQGTVEVYVTMAL